jgi:DNA-binding CsgD family transcriptional regulator
VRERLLAEAQGNPLALLELPVALSEPQLTAGAALPEVLPLSRRLQSLFASRVHGLPSRTRQILLRAALDGTGDLRTLAGAGSSLLDDLAAAERAHVVSVNGYPRRVVFRHPLTRSAVVELATEGERREAHRTLAELSGDRPDRRAWHLAEAAAGPDEGVAGLLEQSAHRVLARGHAVEAIAALVRAAELSPALVDRGRRLTEAAYIGAEGLGELGGAPALLADARDSDPEFGGVLSAAATAFLLLNGDSDLTTAHDLLAAAIANTDHGSTSDRDLVEALSTLALISWLGGRAELWEPVYQALDRMHPASQVVSVTAKTLSDPARTGAAALSDLAALAATLDWQSDPATVNRIATASVFVDRLAATRPATWQVIAQGRQGGPARRHLNGLIHLCVDDFHTGQWDEIGPLADEGLTVCREHGYRFFTWYFRYAQAALAAVRGDDAACRELADQVIRWAVPRGVHGAEAQIRHALVLSAIGGGNFEDAYNQATAISPAGELASHVPAALWTAFDLVEAAVRTGRETQARAHVAAMADAGIAAISSRLALLCHGAAALTVDGDAATKLFDQALAVPGGHRWPFDRARVQLAYGEHLRRGRATTEARAQLAAALENFERIGAVPWAARAASELRATGQANPRARKLGPSPLTSQEHEIAALAAAGLTNKQIAQRLYLSPKTVGNHLFRIFPKLGITSRAALRDALVALSPQQTER